MMVTAEKQRTHPPVIYEINDSGGPTCALMKEQYGEGILKRTLGDLSDTSTYEKTVSVRKATNMLTTLRSQGSTLNDEVTTDAHSSKRSRRFYQTRR